MSELFLEADLALLGPFLASRGLQGAVRTLEARGPLFCPKRAKKAEIAFIKLEISGKNSIFP